MALIRTGVYLEDFLDDCSSLPHELQRLLSTMRELDERSHALQVDIREQVHDCLEVPSLQTLRSTGAPQERILKVEKLRKEIASKQEKAVGLCTEKVLLAQQAYDLLEGHEKRLLEDLLQFEQELKQEGKLPPGDLPPITVTPVAERRRVTSAHSAGPAAGRQSETKRAEIKHDNFRERDLPREVVRTDREGWRDRERGVERAREKVGEKLIEREEEHIAGRDKERDVGLMAPPPPSQRKRSVQSGQPSAGDAATQGVVWRHDKG